VTSFKLAGVQGIKADTPAEALSEINKIGDTNDVGLVLLSDDIGNHSICDIGVHYYSFLRQIIFSLL
jgi:vacuolar-type H+-ATPase subunit F/Vma7